MTPPTLRTQRTWPSLTLGVLAVPSALLASVFGVLLLSLINPDISLSDPPASNLDVFSSLAGMVLLILPPQLMFCALALTAAYASPTPLRARLSLNLPRIPLAIVPLVLLATPVLGYLGSGLSMLFWDQPGENLQMISRIVYDASPAQFLGLLLLISVTPALCEEVLFRGFIQTRLARVWHPAAAIAVSSIFFACVHLEPQHVFAVIPLAVWFGTLAYVSKSLLIPALCHFVNNALACVAMRFSDPDTAYQSMQWTTFDIVVVAASALACLVSLVWIVRAWPQAHTEPFALQDKPNTSH